MFFIQASMWVPPISSLKTFSSFHLTNVTSWSPSTSSHNSMISMSPSSQALAQVVVYRVQVEVWVMKALLKKLFQFRCVHEPLCGMIEQNTLTLWKDIGCILVQGRQIFGLKRFHDLYHIWCHMWHQYNKYDMISCHDIIIHMCVCDIILWYHIMYLIS